MHRRMFAMGLVWAALALVGDRAHAREAFHDLSAEAAIGSSLGRDRLLDVPVYMAGQRHPRVADDLGVFKTNKRTNALNKPDEQACRIAFLSAIITLQKRAIAEGGDVVIDIESVTKHRNLVSATDFRCVAGNVVANVALTGRVVKLEK